MWQMCGDMAVGLGDGLFDFSLDGLAEFIKPCRQTNLLYQRASHGSCSADSKVAGLESRLEQINNLCCEQDGRNVCALGNGPDSCE
jgi:hypothetical protein